MYGQQQQGMYPPQQQQQQQQGYPAGQYPRAYQQQQPNNNNMMMNNNMNMNSDFNPSTNPSMYGGGSMQQPPQNNDYQQQYMYQPNTNMNMNQQNNFNQQPNMNHMNANQQYNVNSQQPYTTAANDFHPLSQPNTGYPHSSHTHNHSQQHPQQAYSNPTMGRPPYIDPETQIVYQCTNPEHEGWLTKQSMWLKDWRRRYFILCGSKLFFAKDPYAAPHGMMDLGTATTVKSADIKSGKNNSFEISTHEHMYFMYADSEKEKDDWIGSVGRAIVRSSGTFLSQKDVKGAGTATGNKVTGNIGAGMNGTRGGSAGNAYGYGEEDDDDDDIYDGVFENSENHPYFND